MLTQSVSWEKTSNMQSQDELYSFLGDRVGGFHRRVVRSGSEGSFGRFYFCRVRAITCTIMHGFQNNLAQLLPLRRRSAI